MIEFLDQVEIDYFGEVISTLMIEDSKERYAKGKSI